MYKKMSEIRDELAFELLMGDLMIKLRKFEFASMIVYVVGLIFIAFNLNWSDVEINLFTYLSIGFMGNIIFYFLYFNMKMMIIRYE